MTSNLLKNHVGDLIARLVTIADFGLNEGIHLVFRRCVQGKSQFAILRRQGRSPVIADFAERANSLRRVPSSNFNPSAEWREITIVVDCDGSICYGVDVVNLTFADGIYTNATKAKADDSEHLEWAAYVEPAVRFALELHIL